LISDTEDLKVPPSNYFEFLKGNLVGFLKLSEYFGTTPQFWLNLQNAYDLHKTSTCRNH